MSLDAKLWVPHDVWMSMQPPLPNKVVVTVTVSVFLTNHETKDIEVEAPTPCDVHYWEITDNEGTRVIQSKPPEVCTREVVSRQIGAGQTIRDDNILTLDGRLFRDGARYLVRYRFWGVDCEDAFVACFAV